MYFVCLLLLVNFIDEKAWFGVLKAIEDKGVLFHISTAYLMEKVGVRNVFLPIRDGLEGM